MSSKLECTGKMLSVFSLLIPELLQICSPKRLTELLELEGGDFFERAIKKTVEEMERATISFEKLTHPISSRKHWAVIKDTSDPLTIFISDLELVPLLKQDEQKHYQGLKSKKKKLSLESFLGNRTKMEKKFGIDLRRKIIIPERAKDLGAKLGERHAKCLLKQEEDFPASWKEEKLKIIFPGTIWRRVDTFGQPDFDRISPTYSDRFMPVIEYFPFGDTQISLSEDCKVFTHHWRLSHISLDGFLETVLPEDNLFFLRQKQEA